MTGVAEEGKQIYMASFVSNHVIIIMSYLRHISNNITDDEASCYPHILECTNC